MSSPRTVMFSPLLSVVAARDGAPRQRALAVLVDAARRRP